MRKIVCQDVPALYVQDELDHFSERLEELNITKESDIISISVRADPHPSKIATPDGTKYSTIIVTIFYWSTLPFTVTTRSAFPKFLPSPSTILRFPRLAGTCLKFLLMIMRRTTFPFCWSSVSNHNPKVTVTFKVTVTLFNAKLTPIICASVSHGPAPLHRVSLYFAAGHTFYYTKVYTTYPLCFIIGGRAHHQKRRCFRTHRRF
jgi:hypothetical protein